jgi:ribosome-associated protein
VPTPGVDGEFYQLDPGREVIHDSAHLEMGKTMEARGHRPRRIAFLEGGPLKIAALREPAAGESVVAERACMCARMAAENKARDVLVLDMRAITPLFDFFVIATGSSRRQIHTLAEEIDAAMAAEGERRLGIEGYEASKWVVQDYGDIVVHLFDPETRAYYALEELWADAPRLDWERA